ncbi:hypothetical protein [uncultured Gammaproteobacteria bacterium]|nr:hypothetical protein [uncultured Gammaproteobacteria bacterium]CAC9659653.1 hypothetical protein [uncultured Gammaproteobacteria bacterium]
MRPLHNLEFFKKPFFIQLFLLCFSIFYLPLLIGRNNFLTLLTTQWLWIDNHKRAHFPLGGILPRAKMA